MKKKVLIVSYSYPPANAPAAQRPYAIAKYLNKDKYDVTVLTCGNQDSSLGFDPSFDYDLDGVRLLKVKSFDTSSQREVKKNSMQGGKLSFKQKIKKTILNTATFFIFPDRAVFWIPFLLNYLIRNKKDLQADIIISTSPFFTNHIVARLLKKFNSKAAHIADFRDFHYTSNYEIKKGVKAYFHKIIERNVINKSDKITFVSESMKNIYSAKYPEKQDKFYVVYNGYENNEFVDLYKPEGEALSIFYAGSFYGGVRSPKPLLYALEELIEKNIIKATDIKIEIAGNIEQDLVDEIAHLAIFKSICFLGLLPRNEVMKKYCQTHLLWMIVGDDINHYSSVPIKMFEYLATGRYVLNFAPKQSETDNLIKIANAGWNFENEDISIDNVVLLEKIIGLHNIGKLANTVDLSSLSIFERKNQISYLETLL
jgi:glycosyltransferase involved in cell wall biosynthesis